MGAWPVCQWRRRSRRPLLVLVLLGRRPCRQGAHHPAGPGILKGQFELAGEFMPLWQSYTPAAQLTDVTYTTPDGVVHYGQVPYGGGTFTGISHDSGDSALELQECRKAGAVVSGSRRPYLDQPQVSAGLPCAEGVPGGTSVWNFAPQFGVGLHYFVKPKRRSRSAPMPYISPAPAWATIIPASMRACSSSWAIPGGSNCGRTSAD